MTNFHYVYVLQSLSHPQQIYTGVTADLKKRLAKHNAGRVPHTSGCHGRHAAAQEWPDAGVVGISHEGQGL